MRPLAWIGLAVIGAFVGLSTACSGPADDSESSAAAVAVAGRWSLPASVREAGADVRLTYDGAPRWTGTGACSGRLRTGARRLGQFVMKEFPEVTSIGGYACRRNTADGSRMSVHGTGRAMDVFIPKVGGAADNSKGDKVANWLVEHAQEIGVQLVIWDRAVWRGNGTNESSYGGPHPHDDHLHVELTNAAGNAQTQWFLTNADTDGGDDDDGGMDMDAGEDPTDDDGGTKWEDDEPADSDGGSSGPPKTDAGKTDAGKTDAGTAQPGGSVPLPEDDPPPSGWEIEEGEDGPGEQDSLGKTRPSSRRSRDALGLGGPASSGCSAAPARGVGSTGGLLATALALAALSVGARRRRRDRASRTV